MPVPQSNFGVDPKSNPELRNEASAMDAGFVMGRETLLRDKNGLYKNEVFRGIASQAVIESREQDNPLSIIISDLDGLKAINDSLGHQAGDEVIDETATIINTLVNEADIPLEAGRIGGDEFALLCHGDEEDTRKVAQELERVYKAYVNRPDNEKVQSRGLDLSLGFATLSNDLRTFSDIMSEADMKMYENKEAKLGELSRRQKLGLRVARLAVKFSGQRLRDVPKHWKRMGVLDD